MKRFFYRKFSRRIFFTFFSLFPEPYLISGFDCMFFFQPYIIFICRVRGVSKYTHLTIIYTNSMDRYVGYFVTRTLGKTNTHERTRCGREEWLCKNPGHRQRRLLRVHVDPLDTCSPDFRDPCIDDSFQHYSSKFHFEPSNETSSFLAKKTNTNLPGHRSENLIKRKLSIGPNLKFGFCFFSLELTPVVTIEKINDDQRDQ